MFQAKGLAKQEVGQVDVQEAHTALTVTTPRRKEMSEGGAAV